MSSGRENWDLAATGTKSYFSLFIPVVLAVCSPAIVLLIEVGEFGKNIAARIDVLLVKLPVLGCSNHQHHCYYLLLMLSLLLSFLLLSRLFSEHCDSLSYRQPCRCGNWISRS